MFLQQADFQSRAADAGISLLRYKLSSIAIILN